MTEKKRNKLQKEVYVFATLFELATEKLNHVLTGFLVGGILFLAFPNLSSSLRFLLYFFSMLTTICTSQKIAQKYFFHKFFSDIKNKSERKEILSDENLVRKFVKEKNKELEKYFDLDTKYKEELNLIMNPTSEKTQEKKEFSSFVKEKTAARNANETRLEPYYIKPKVKELKKTLKY